MTRSDFNSNAIKYANELKKDGDMAGYSVVINTLTKVVNEYEPLFKGNAWQIAFNDDSLYSLGNLTK